MWALNVLCEMLPVLCAPHFFKLVVWCSILWVDHVLFNKFPIDGHLGCFQIFDLMDRAAVNRFVHMSFHFLIVYLGYVPRGEIAESKDKCMSNLLLDIAKFFAIGVVPFCILNDDVFEGLFLYIISKRVYCHAFGML